MACITRIVASDAIHYGACVACMTRDVVSVALHYGAMCGVYD